MLSESPSVTGAFADDSVEATYKRVAWRIVPLLLRHDRDS
jgi:hypothetical protein